MNWIIHFAKAFPPRTGLVFFFGLLLSACGRDDVKSYRVPKESPAMTATGLPAGHPDISPGASSATPPATPRLSWTLPAGWQEAGASKMSLATFNIAGTDGKQAQVTVTPLRGLAGKEVLIVNMWRQQVGQTELSADEVTQQLQPVEIGGELGKMFEITGKAEGTDSPVRIVTAMRHQADTSWFFKLAGDIGIVEAQKPAFVAFLKSLKITDTSTTIAATTPAPAPTETTPPESSQWKTPADWKSVEPGPMQNAKFMVPERDGSKADVTVSIFPSATGTTLMNVNRWRGQIGLSPTDEAGLAKIAMPLDEKNPDAILVDMTNNNQQLVAAALPRGGQWYFYKLKGDPAAVASQKKAFLTFVKAQP